MHRSLSCAACYILLIAYHAALIILQSICSATSTILLKMCYSSKVWGKLGAVELLDMKIKLPIAISTYAALQVKADGGVANTSIQLCPDLPQTMPNTKDKQLKG